MNYSLTEEEWECVRVCVSNAPIPYDITMKKIPGDIFFIVVSNAPIPYDITMKKIPGDILAKIGKPTPRKGEPLEIPYYDLTPYGIEPLT